MLYGLLVTLFVVSCILLLLVIMIQQGKGGGIGFGSFGGGSQALFGGSGGQDLFQKITWVLGAIFIFGSLGLALLKTHTSRTSRYFPQVAQQAIQQPTESEHAAPAHEGTPQA